MRYICITTWIKKESCWDETVIIYSLIIIYGKYTLTSSSFLSSQGYSPSIQGIITSPKLIICPYILKDIFCLPIMCVVSSQRTLPLKHRGHMNCSSFLSNNKIFIYDLFRIILKLFKNSRTHKGFENPCCI